MKGCAPAGAETVVVSGIAAEPVVTRKHRLLACVPRALTRLSTPERHP